MWPEKYVHMCCNCKQLACIENKEIEFFKRFFIPVVKEHKELILYCSKCYSSYIYKNIASESHQEQRVKLINSTSYLGVLSIDVTRMKLRSIAGLFMWEFQARDPFYCGGLVVAVSNVPDGNLGIVNNYSAYIICLPNGSYGTVINADIFYKNDPSVKYIVYPTLEDAIHSSKNELCVLKDTMHLSRFSGKSSEPKKFSCRSLQDLCAFFIKSYCFHNKSELFRLTHRICREIIVESAAVGVVYR
jgi:hypothetical protein